MASTKRTERPSAGRQIGLGLALLLMDLLVIAWLLYGYAMTGWADAYDDADAQDAPRAARQAMWFLTCGAVVTGGGLLALRWRICGVLQLLVLGGGAVAFALAAR
ncbi:hypothetical protein [Streptomyces sp. NPDC026673]|uniref:hypothetical protein n=1 Tax=Streptomyces sp. NPDC026673 TaxID=3155724 RepID=UPI0033D4DB24